MSSTLPTTTDNNVSIESLFNQVVDWIRELPAEAGTSTDTKLQLYGCFKRATQGVADPSQCPTLLRYEAHCKYQAWLACSNLSPEEAMKEYVRVAGTLDNSLNEKCRVALDEYRQRNGSNQNSNLELDVQISICKPTRLSRIASALGIRPLIPRGQLDLDYADLLFGLKACIRPTTSHDQLRAYCDDQFGLHSVVGLSVRSLLDLYLTVRKYPKGSEFIMSPPINVPGMSHVLAHHGITIVPIDLPVNETTSGGDAHVGGTPRNAARIAVDTRAIERAITTKTKAILVVHPFGMPSASDDEMKYLSKLAQTNKLDLLEDCAECYAGMSKSNSAFQHSPHADVVFYSFGWIKTSTAVGGGIAIMKNETLAADMHRIQVNIFAQQSTLAFLFKLIKGCLMKCVAGSPILFGFFALILQWCGLSLDKAVTAAVRGFANTDPLKRMQQIRQKPCSALLSLLRRRLGQSVNGVRSVTDRHNRCNKVLAMLGKTDPEMVAHLNEKSTFWLFPVLSNEPDRMCRRLRQAGYDTTRGLSQLKCVSEESVCPVAWDLMNRAVYLPISSQEMSETELLRLVRSIHTPTIDQPDFPSKLGKKERALSYKVSMLIAIAACFAFFSVQTILALVVTGVQCGLVMCTVAVVVSVCLRWTMADFYLENDTCFARWNKMLAASEMTESDKAKATYTTFQPHNGILLSLKDLETPSLENDERKKVFITGATGFVGSMLLRDLLLRRKSLNIQEIIVLCRAKRNKSPRNRIETLLSGDMFSFVAEDVKKSMIRIVEGDVTKENGGLCDADLAMITNDSKVTHVFHCAASVSFTQSLPDAARCNIFSSLQMKKITQQLKCRSAKFVHVSTAFVHGGSTGTVSRPLREELYSLGNYEPARLYSSMLGTQFYASNAMYELGFHNTYTFSKCICEHLLLQESAAEHTLIIRPSIVGPAIESPYEGWAGSTPSTIVAASCLYLSYQWNLWSFGNHQVPCIPIDVLSGFILGKAFSDASISDSSEDESSKDGEASNDGPSSSDGSYEKIPHLSLSTGVLATSKLCGSRCQRIFNATWNDSSPKTSMFTWLQFTVSMMQMGAVLGYFTRPTAYIGIAFAGKIVPWASLSTETFRCFHKFVIEIPFNSALRAFEYVGINCSQMMSLSPFLDLPVLFYPFMNNSFHFESSLTAPSTFDGSRYMFSCTTAAHKFMEQSKHRDARKTDQSLSKLSSVPYLCVGGALHRPLCSDAWWALTLPRGNIFVRVAGWLIAKVFRIICTEVTVDSNSFSAAASVWSSSENDRVTIVLAPTHRSFLDFIVLSYIAFSIPELQIDIPFIAAADEFEKVPIIGWLSSRLRAFFVRRDRKHEDPRLRESLVSIKKLTKVRNPVVEVFIEGTRSRDRRFVEPKTGLLRCVQNLDRCVVVPIVVSHERIPEQDQLANEAAGGVRKPMSLLGLLRWLRRVAAKQVSLGKIHVSACTPIPILHEKDRIDVRVLATKIQIRQQEKIYISDFHVNATARFLKLDIDSAHNALRCLDCNFWPETGSSASLLAVPDDSIELASLLFQASPQLSRLFTESRPNWSSWLCRVPNKPHDLSVFKDPAVVEISKRMHCLFDAADKCTVDALALLHAKGFQIPKFEHVLQTCRLLDKSIPSILLRASISMHLKCTSTEADSDQLLLDNRCNLKYKLADSSEILGFWGFDDSSFVVQTDASGSPYVSMAGNRYGRGEERMTKLLPFIQEEMGVKVDLLHEAFLDKAILPLPLSKLSNDDIKLLKPCFVSFADEDRLRRGTGHSQEDVFAIRSGQLPRVPDAVVWPETENDVENIVRIAKQQSWCLMPFGGGTNVSHATRCPPLDTEPRPILSVDMKKMSRILWIDEENGLARVEAGITGRRLVEEMSLRGYTIGHEPDSIEFSTLGGWIATKASGMKRNKYGNIEDIVKAVRVAGPDGILFHGDEDKAIWGRESSGLDLCTLIFGSEGCLGIVTSAVIRIWPTPAIKVFDGILFPNFESGVRFARAVTLHGNIPASIRVLDNEHFRLGQALRANPKSLVDLILKPLTKTLLLYVASLQSNEVACATISYEGSKEEVAAQKASLARLWRDHGGIRLGAQVGKDGYDLTFMIAYLRDFAMTYHFLGESFETFAPWSKLDSVVKMTKKRIAKEHAERCLPGKPFIGCRVTQLYHEGACLYFYFCMNFENVAKPSKVFSAIEHAAREEILLQGGSLSHHHGVGKLRAAFLPDIDSETLRTSLLAVKKGFDPANIFGSRNGPFARG
jgi:alkyldihydroxyacetonephosphate synthase